MLTGDQSNKILNYLNSLQTEYGGYSNFTQDSMMFQSTLSCMKSLEFFGISPQRPDDIFSYVKSFYDRKSSSFVDVSTGRPSVLTTAVALLILNQIGARDFLDKHQLSCLEYMNKNATVREEHFMLIGVVDECKISFQPVRSIQYFREMEEDNGMFGPSILNNAIASSAILRMGECLKKPSIIQSLLLEAQQEDGGFADSLGSADLWTSYCVMRTLDLLHARPNVNALQSWILSMYKEQGGFSLSVELPSANETYQCLSILNWISSPVIRAAQNGDLSGIDDWLRAGGNPDVKSLEGWTPLLAASVRGQSNVVEYLLSDSIKGSKPANLNIKLESADASAAFWAGQSGDLKTIQCILKNNPDLLFDISLVNGHNITLQAAFFGSERHLNMARWILENIGEILDIDENDVNRIEAARLKLTTLTNVRGYNCLTMSRLWGNLPMEELFARHDKSTEEDRQLYLQNLLAKIAPLSPSNEAELVRQQLSDQFIKVITDGFLQLGNISGNERDKIEELQNQTMKDLQWILSNPDFDINHQGGPLSGTPVIIAITGVDSEEYQADFRYKLVKFLLDSGANPDLPEKHPMAVDAVIRAAVLNQFNILKLISEYMRPLAFAAAMNEKPPINGQTALQDTVHRALTSDNVHLESHLEQIRWSVSKGARYDIEDHTGTSPEKLAKEALNDSVYRKRAAVVIEALGLSEAVPQLVY